MVTTPPAPQSQGCDLVQGKPNSNKWLLNSVVVLQCVVYFAFICLKPSIPDYFLGWALLVTDASILTLYVCNLFSYWGPSEGLDIKKVQLNIKAYSSFGKASHSIKLNSFLASFGEVTGVKNAFLSSGLWECCMMYLFHTTNRYNKKGFVLSAGMVREHACRAPRWLHRQWYLWSTARSPTCLWIVTSFSSSTFFSATSLPSLSIMSTSIRRCGGTHSHTLPHTHLL